MLRPLQRFHETLEIERRRLPNGRWLNRRASRAGVWRRDGRGCVESMSLPGPDFFRLESLAEEHLSAVARLTRRLGLELRRASLREESRKIGCQSWRKRLLYVEVASAGEIYATLVGADRQGFESLVIELEAMARFVAMKTIKHLPDAAHLVLEGPAFGYFLHECLGHRLEGDDFEEPIPFGTKINNVNFEVVDSPGVRGWAGWVPFDDEGTPTVEARLLAAGRQGFLSARTGNMRASGFEHHAIVRQRTLVCRTTREIQPNEVPKGPSLIIKSVASGEFSGASVTLESGMQIFADGRGRFARLPRSTLCFDLADLLRMRTFGSQQLHHPGGGCHKGLQRGLEVSFYAPSATMKL